MNTKELYDFLNREYNAPFIGWDFSYLHGRMEQDPLPWSYKQIIQRYITGKSTLLDIDTGGGEFLSKVDNLPKNVYATEGYEPNLKIAKDRLGQKGITVVHTTEYDRLPFDDDYFEIILNRHGTFRIHEIKRLLSINGVFITQQVGSLNAIDLSASLGSKRQIDKYEGLLSALIDARNNKMKVIDYCEILGKYRFYDIGAVVYYLKCIPWQIEDFSVDKYFQKLQIMNDVIEDKGYIECIMHRYYLIIQKNNE